MMPVYDIKIVFTCKAVMPYTKKQAESVVRGYAAHACPPLGFKRKVTSSVRVVKEKK